MKHLFVPYEIAKQLKEKGFDEECFKCFRKYSTFELVHADEIHYKNSIIIDDSVTAPLYQQVVDWFRDKHKLHFFIVPYGDTKSWSLVNINHIDIKGFDGRSEYHIRNKYDKVKFTSYYEALDKAIEEALKLI